MFDLFFVHQQEGFSGLEVVDSVAVLRKVDTEYLRRSTIQESYPLTDTISSRLYALLDQMGQTGDTLGRHHRVPTGGSIDILKGKPSNLSWTKTRVVGDREIERPHRRAPDSDALGSVIGEQYGLLHQRKGLSRVLHSLDDRPDLLCRISVDKTQVYGMGKHDAEGYQKLSPVVR